MNIKLYILAIFSFIFLMFGLLYLRDERAKMYAPIIRICEEDGGLFHCLHGMCHCHEGNGK
jgi:hypothetical protein